MGDKESGRAARERKARPYLRQPEKTIEVTPKSVSGLLDAMSQTGFQGKRLGEAARIWSEMVQQKGLTIFMGYAGSMSTTGQWKIVRWLIENRYIDVLVSTGANVSEDIFEAMGHTYYQGTWMANDEALLEAKIDRFYDVYADEYDYRELESLIKEFAATLDPGRPYSTREFLNRFGEFQWKKGIKSITATAWKHGVPIYSPGLIDSGYGVALSLLKREGKLIRLDQTQDMEELGQVAERTKRTGVVYIGGGVPKDTIQLATIIKSLAEGGEDETPHDYAIQITTDSPQWGGLSGCTLEEAISWGKIAADSKRSVVYCDATLALPLIAHAMLETAKGRKDPPDLSWVFKNG
ncbi:MAG: deoxyhypusine synthase [Nitrososphaerota archaeon]|nr:deoxyhypusine synthase [Nitrososphaerota archaeon]MDG6966699.1 deoxyhypusine synthase [Nitrososphaerota archaeon]MDG6979278.1 deoxyhypusine synthase [Nitrososphaerota archaeon]MDG7006200.1 deoxyhypusine synthase [Nitrososphaerota archaeon]MDG7021452.1 deoxyhypusine synthase [Nitrososphaerota archaeon]